MLVGTAIRDRPQVSGVNVNINSAGTEPMTLQNAHSWTKSRLRLATYDRRMEVLSVERVMGPQSKLQLRLTAPQARDALLGRLRSIHGRA
jgi:hypothetical protein